MPQTGTLTSRLQWSLCFMAVVREVDQNVYHLKGRVDTAVILVHGLLQMHRVNAQHGGWIDLQHVRESEDGLHHD